MIGNGHAGKKRARHHLIMEAEWRRYGGDQIRPGRCASRNRPYQTRNRAAADLLSCWRHLGDALPSWPSLEGGLTQSSAGAGALAGISGINGRGGARNHRYLLPISARGSRIRIREPNIKDKRGGCEQHQHQNESNLAPPLGSGWRSSARGWE